uniref:Uncharacterized protein n=1 Tax=Mus spicilegus TaxID=10103 RepID=A0A8C6H728_MUSSI
VVAQHNHDHITHPEVLRIHMQLVTVELTEAGKGALEAVQVIQAIVKGSYHLFAMGLHFGITHDSRVPLAALQPGYQPAQGLTTNFIGVHLCPQARDNSLLSISQVHHDVCFWGCESTQLCQKQM